MSMVREKELEEVGAPKPALSEQQIRHRIEVGCSPNYHGDPDNEGNMSADIPDELNCSFWLTNLPPYVTINMLLGKIRDVGRIYAVSISKPDPEKGHLTCAAKLVFFNVADATRFLGRYPKYGSEGLVMDRYRAMISRNRTRVAEKGHLPVEHTRAIIITGPKEVVNERTIMEFLKPKFVFVMDEVIYLV
ncbi:hypothetical protein B0T24DRAFT_635243, partial [Lasiosphaeria ovina]